MNILRSKYVQALLLTVCQIVAFIVVYEAFWRLYIALAPNFRRDISWGLTVRFAVMIFAVISLIGAIIGNLLFLPGKLVGYALSDKLFIGMRCGGLLGSLLPVKERL